VEVLKHHEFRKPGAFEPRTWRAVGHPMRSYGFRHTPAAKFLASLVSPLGQAAA
jgi:hypothetical protein